MKIGIVSSNPNWSTLQLIESFKKRGCKTFEFSVREIVGRVSYGSRFEVKGFSLDELSAIVVRGIGMGSLEEVILRMDVLHRLSETVPVINSPHSIERATNKYYTSSLIESLGLNSPKVFVSEDYVSAIKGFKELGEDVVIKPIFGSSGEGSTRINNMDIAKTVFKALRVSRTVYYLQEYIEHGNEDIRCLVIGDEVVASVKRVGIGWKTNVSLGAKCIPFDVPDEIRENCVRLSRSLGCTYCGIDLIFSNGKYYFIEANAIPSWAGLQSATGVEVADKITDYILSSL